MGNRQIFNVNCFVEDHVSFVAQQQQKKDLSPISVKQRKKLKYVKGVSCADQLFCVQHVSNVHNEVFNKK